MTTSCGSPATASRGVTLEQIAADFGVHPMTLSKWLRQADVEDGVRPGVTARRVRRAARAREADQAAGAGERGAAPGGGVSVAGEPAGKRLYPLVSELAADGIPVAVTCRVLEARPPALLPLAGRPGHRRRAGPRRYRANALFDAHRDDPEFGYRFLVDEARDAGAADGRADRVADLLGQRLVERVRQESAARTARAGPPVHDDLVERDFTAEAPNQLWLTDITEHRTGEGKLYLCAIKDVCSNRIVGYSIDSRMKSRLAVAALEQRRRQRAQR